MTTTIGRWIDVSTDRVAPDAPLGAGLVQIIGSNATLAARENNLRMLWEHPGSANIYADLPGGGVDFFDWDTESTSGRFTAYCGYHRIRRHGETLGWPQLELRGSALAPATFELGILLVAMPAPGQPDTRATYGVRRLTNTSLATFKLTVPLTSVGMGSMHVAPRAGTGTLITLDEDGTVPAQAIYLGAWCTSGSGGGKAEMRGLTLYLVEP